MDPTTELDHESDSLMPNNNRNIFEVSTTKDACFKASTANDTCFKKSNKDTIDKWQPKNCTMKVSVNNNNESLNS